MHASRSTMFIAGGTLLVLGLVGSVAARLGHSSFLARMDFLLLVAAVVTLALGALRRD